MSLTRTADDLSDAVLREMGVVDAVETADTTDIDYISGVYELKFHELVDREIAYWSVDAIPREVFLTMRDLIVNEVRGAYGDPIDPGAKAQSETVLLMQLRRHTQRRPSGHAAQADYF